jgi:nucleoside-diphosphate-sugar epimerase
MSIYSLRAVDRRGPAVRIFGDGSSRPISRGRRRPWHGRALRPAGYEIINLGGDRPWEMLEVVRHIERLLEKEARVQHLAAAPGDVRATWADIGKAGSLLNWRPEVELGAGLEACVRWYLEQREWARAVDTAD